MAVQRGENALKLWGSTRLGRLRLADCEQLWHELDSDLKIVEVNLTVTDFKQNDRALSFSSDSSNSQTKLDASDAKQGLGGSRSSSSSRSPTVAVVLARLHVVLARMHTLIPVLRDLQVTIFFFLNSYSFSTTIFFSTESSFGRTSLGKDFCCSWPAVED
jgi:hypothetical protein